MEPEAQIVVFAIVSLLFFMVSMFADGEDWFASAGSTGVLVGYWALNTILWMTGHVENWTLPSDVVFGLSAVALAAGLRKPWLYALSALFLINLMLDVLHLAGRIGYESWAEAGNVTFILQLGTASFPGLVRITRSLARRAESSVAG